MDFCFFRCTTQTHRHKFDHYCYILNGLPNPAHTISVTPGWWQRQWVWKGAKHELWWFMLSPFKAVDNLHALGGYCFQVFSGSQKGFSVGICNNCHQLVGITWISAAPVRVTFICVAVYRSLSVNKLHGLHTPSLRDFECTISVISSSKANRISVDFLPVFCNRKYYLLVYYQNLGWWKGYAFVRKRSTVSDPFPSRNWISNVSL